MHYSLSVWEAFVWAISLTFSCSFRSLGRPKSVGEKECEQGREKSKVEREREREKERENW